MDGVPEDWPWCRDYARAILARWGTPAIEPVPVSERLPGPEDCDAKGRCWVGNAVPKDDLETKYNSSWELCKFHPPDEVWLPHHALPMPAPANNTREENLDG